MHLMRGSPATPLNGTRLHRDHKCAIPSPAIRTAPVSDTFESTRVSSYHYNA